MKILVTFQSAMKSQTLSELRHMLNKDQYSFIAEHQIQEGCALL